MRLELSLPTDEGTDVRVYNVEDNLNKVSLGNINILRESTSKGGRKPVTMTTIGVLFLKMQEQSKLAAKVAEEHKEAGTEVTLEEQIDLSQFQGEDWYLPNVIGLIFLMRRAEGESATYKEAEDLPHTAWRFLPDESDVEDDAEEEAGPKESEAGDDSAPEAKPL